MVRATLALCLSSLCRRVCSVRLLTTAPSTIAINLLPNKLLALHKLGLPPLPLQEALRKNPHIASFSSPHFHTRLLFFSHIGIAPHQFCKILLLYPHVLGLSVENDLALALSLLKSALGDVLVKCILLWPSILGVIPQENFEEKLQFLLEAGFKKGSVELGRALSCVLPKNTQDLEAIMNTLLSLGLSHNHVCRIVKRYPAVFEQDNAEITTKFDYLLNTLCFSLQDLVKYPSFITYSLELRLKPRIKMHSWLKSRGLVRRNFKLDYIVSMPEKQFLQKFVKSHPDGPRIYHEFMGIGK